MTGATMDMTMSSKRQMTLAFSKSIFFTGVAYASTIQSAGLVAVNHLGFANAGFAMLSSISSFLTAITSMTCGWLGDRARDRLWFIATCSGMGSLGYGVVYAIHTPLAFIIAYSAEGDPRTDFLRSVLRTIFAVSWVVVPPAAALIASFGSLLDAYALASISFAVCGSLTLVQILLAPSAAKVDMPKAPVTGTGSGFRTSFAWGLAGLVCIRTSLTPHSMPLAIANGLGGTPRDVWLALGMAAAIGIPCIILWGAAVTRHRKEHRIVFGGGLAAACLVLAAHDLIFLQVPNAITLAAFLSIPITYVQEVAPGRLGLPTSNYDVILVLGGVSAGRLFALTPTNGIYRKELYFCLLSTLAGLFLMSVSSIQRGQQNDH
jgi:MFS transporter, SET family, sugar efflux transporter